MGKRGDTSARLNNPLGTCAKLARGALAGPAGLGWAGWLRGSRRGCLLTFWRAEPTNWSAKNRNSHRGRLKIGVAPLGKLMPQANFRRQGPHSSGPHISALQPDLARTNGRSPQGRHFACRASGLRSHFTISPFAIPRSPHPQTATPTTSLRDNNRRPSVASHAFCFLGCCCDAGFIPSLSSVHTVFLIEWSPPRLASPH